MKWTGWSWEEYLATPMSVVDEVIAIMHEENEAYEEARREE